MKKRINNKKLISFVVVFLVFATFFTLVIEPTTLNIVLSGLVSYVSTNFIVNVLSEKKVFSKVRFMNRERL